MEHWKRKAFNIRVFMDGDQWCALIGTDLQSGDSGWGNSPEAAIANLARRFGGGILPRRHSLSLLQKLKDTAG